MNNHVNIINFQLQCGPRSGIGVQLRFLQEEKDEGSALRASRRSVCRTASKELSGGELLLTLSSWLYLLFQTRSFSVIA